MIKKYTKQKAFTFLGEQLDAYKKQATDYRKQNRRKRSINLKKGTLAALIPLAAATAANAQCGSTQATVTLNAAGGSQSNQIDIDGGGNDFQFVHQKFYGPQVALFGLGSNSFITLANNVRRLALNYTVTTGKNFAQGGFYNWKIICNGAGGSFEAGHSTTDNFIGIKKGTKLGFIRLEVSTCNPGGDFIFKITDMAYETDGNSHVITGDCSTIGAAAPVEMMYFRTRIQDNKVLLQWATATEINNSGFEIQRSTDGRLYHKIGWVNGNDTTTENIQYSFNDEHIQPNTTYYYRLKQVDHDGTEEFSDIQSIMLKNNAVVHVSDFFPNPITKSYPLAWIKINLPEAEQGLIEVFDSRGILVKTFEESLEAGQNRLSLHMEDLVAGQYFAKIQMGTRVAYKKLVVK